jgi:hypothetical protein
MKGQKRTSVLEGAVSSLLVDQITADPSLQHLNVFKLFGLDGEDVTVIPPR